jgi:hypothetical protein
MRSFASTQTAITIPEHRPKAHQKYLRVDAFALAELGRRRRAAYRAVVPADLGRQTASGLGYRACLGLVHLAGKHSTGRLEAAAAPALHFGAYTFDSIASILRHHLESEPLPGTVPTAPAALAHANIRGAAYFDSSQ